MRKCPICKSKIKELHDYDAYHYYCTFNRNHFHEVTGMSHRITVNGKTMYDIYGGTFRHFRIQNRIINRWIKQGRKQYNRKG